MTPVVGLCLFAAVLCGTIVNTDGKFLPDIRLPKSILPEHYSIGIIPDIHQGNADIEGFVHLDFFVQSPTDRIVMHAVNLTLNEESIVVNQLPSKAMEIMQENDVSKISSTGISEKSKMLKVLRPVSYDVEKEFAIIHLGSKLEENRRYRVSLNYSGSLAKNLKGFYGSEYLDRKSKTKKWVGVTQFEPTSARLAFPCLDEPAMKATFTMSIGRRTNYTSLSNMPLVKSEPMSNKEGWFWDFYEKSVPMSTYLIACLVSEFSFRQARPVIRKDSDNQSTQNVTDIRIWARADAIDQVDLAVKVTPNMLEFLEEYFQVSFPLPKIDLVGLPDFSSGAMENWGLVTYRETTLLVNPKSAAVRDEMNVERVIAHELAHQWFGNLVTMDWWNALWLNEGFATYVQRLVLDNVSPKYQYGTLQALDFLSVMDADGLESSHAISVDVAHPTQITEIFDAISYTKSAAVIRMMNDFLGEATFRQGITNYLNEKKYKNAQQDELWQFLSEQAHRDAVLPLNLDVKMIMDTWTLQMGFPVITIVRNYTDGYAFISQKRFLRGVTPITSSDEKSRAVTNSVGSKRTDFPTYRWWVPVSLTDSVAHDFNQSNTRPAVWLTPSELSATKFIGKNEDSWVIANILATGYYRVNYDERNWGLLDLQLKTDHQVIHPINRAYLIDDAFALAAAEILPYPTAFNLIEYLPNEDHHVPWTSAFRALNYIGRMFSYTKDHGRYKAFMRSLVVPSYIRIGNKFQADDSPLTKMLRISMTTQACSQEYRPCIRQAQLLFDEWMDSPDPIGSNSIIPDLRSSTYCTAIKYGGQLEWDFAWRMSFNMTSAQDRDVILSALGCSRDPWILIRYLSFVLDPSSGIRKQDGRRVISAVASNPGGRRIAFQFVLNHFEEMFSYFGNPVRVLQMLSSTTSSLNTPEELVKIQKLMESKVMLLQKAQTSANNIQSVVSANIKWMDKNFKNLNQWFDSKGF